MPFPGVMSKSGVRAVSEVARACWPVAWDDAGCYDRLLQEIGDARVVLIGEASHGTHEFYRERARITRRLIEEKRFKAVAAEADWPDAHHLSRWARGGGHEGVEGAVAEFRRFPAWMWRNMDVLNFAEWLREWNAKSGRGVEFYGLDLYSMYRSAQAVLRYLEKTDPEAAARARFRYACFEHFGEDTQAYGYAANFNMTESCERGVVAQLTEMRRKMAETAANDGMDERRDAFSAEQNARVVRDAEMYYRTMFSGRVSSWNLRDRHMMETLVSVMDHLGEGAKVVVWAHNSHLGDARATEMGRRGELNLGQLVRERWGKESFLIGQTTYCGEVTAATDWDEPAERKLVRRGLTGSYEALFHEVGIDDFVLPLRDVGVRNSLMGPLLERAIGVIYRPETERMSHYFEARLPDQFDAVIHMNRTRALIPLEKTVPWQAGEVPETYPSAV